MRVTDVWPKRLFWLLGIILPLCFVPIVWAQSSGATTTALTGNVKDNQGAIIGGAVVTTRNLQTNLTREIITGEDGVFFINQLPPGSYEVSVKADGFNAGVTKLELVLGTTTLFNFTLSIGTASEVVEIIASDAMDDGKTEQSTNIDSMSIDTLPINRRDFLDFSLTVARVTLDRAPGQGASATSKLSFNAQSARNNNITIDGLDNNDIGSGSVRSTVSQDAVQEFQVVSNNFSAEFGRALGGIVNIVTRGGTNDTHGTLFFFNRNDSISARDVFTAIKPPYQQYQFGTTLSGAIKKDKIFYFTSFERLSIKQNNIVTISSNTVRAANDIGLALRNGPVPLSVGSTTFLSRVDMRLRPDLQVYVRYNYGGNYNGALEPFGGLVGDTNGGIQQLRDNTFAVSATYINSGLNLINEARFLFGPRDQNVRQVDPGPQIRLFAPEGLTIFGRGTFLPQNRDMKTYQIIDNVSLSRGRHQIKFGVDYDYQSLDDLIPIFPGGLALFQSIDFTAVSGIPNLPTFTALEAFDPALRSPAQLAFLAAASGIFPNFFPGFPTGVPLPTLSLPIAYTQGFGSATTEINTKLITGYVQDDIKIKSNLLVKLGLRYDLNRVDPIPDNNGNFSPRVAFAYRPKALPRLNIHGAYGLFFTAPITGSAVAIALSQMGKIRFPATPFPFSVIPFSQPGHRLPETIDVPKEADFDPAFNSVLVYEKNIRNSYSQQVNFGLDYFIGDNTVISVGYDYVRGIKLFAPRNINPVVRPVPGNPVLSVQTGRPIPGVGDVAEFGSFFDSYFHGVTISANRRFTKNFGFLVHYTFSKALDNSIDFRPDLQEMVDSFRLDLERGLSLQDVRNRFVLSGVYDLNYFQNRVLKGFQLSSIITLESGRPFNLLAGTDLNMSGDALLPGDRPLVGGTSIGRNAGVTPGFASVDMRLTRNIDIKEKVHIQGFFEVFNLFNRVNISEVDRVFPPDAKGNFNLPAQDNGRYIATKDRYRNAFAARQFQFGFRVAF